MANQKKYVIQERSNYLSISVVDITFVDGKELQTIIDIVDVPKNYTRINTSTEETDFGIERTQLSFVTNNVNALNINRYYIKETEVREPVYQTDDNGDLILDEFGKPIPVLDENGEPLFTISLVNVYSANLFEIDRILYDFEGLLSVLFEKTGIALTQVVSNQ